MVDHRAFNPVVVGSIPLPVTMYVITEGEGVHGLMKSVKRSKTIQIPKETESEYDALHGYWISCLSCNEHVLVYSNYCSHCGAKFIWEKRGKEVQL